MPVSKYKKSEIINSLKEDLKQTKSVFFVKNKGLSVADLKTLRTSLRENGGKFTVAKRTLIKKSVKDSYNIDIVDNYIDGPVGMLFSFDDALLALKAVADYSKKSENIELVSGILDGKLVDTKDTVKLSKLPGRKELLAKLCGSMNAPLSNFVGVNKNLISGFTRVINSYKEKKENNS